MTFTTLSSQKKSILACAVNALKYMVLCVAIVAPAARAQSQISLLFPQGLPLAQNSGNSFMMGGSSAGVSDDYNCMLGNPANLGFIDKTVFSSLYMFDFNRIDQAHAHTNFVQAFPQQISLGIPFGSFGTLGLSYNVQSNTAVKFRPGQKQIGFADSSVTYQAGLAVTGGTTMWQAGWGRELPGLMHLRIGVTYERIYYTASSTVVRTITDPSKTVESRDSTVDELRANGLRAGLMLPLGKFKAGVSGEYFFPADLHHDNAIYSNSSDTVGPRGTVAVPVDQIVATPSVRMPPSLRFGLSYAISPEWLAAADLASTFWDKYYSHGFLASARTNALSVSAGAQYVPVSTLMAPRYWETIHYSAGFRYTQLPANVSSEFALSLGTGLPIARGRGLLTLGLEAGRRTVGSYSDISENFVHFAVGINGSRKWNKSSFGLY